ncbi:MAG TPA: hypothetical protein VGZ71_06060 [Puia sp.]|nr:hypothetical protein [Puia sp.]
MKSLLKRIIPACLTPILLLACARHMEMVKSTAAPNYANIISSECNFILAHQLSDGALTMSANRDIQGYKIVPYFSNIAAQALLENPTTVNIIAVKKWMAWYMAHLNTDGSVYDYYASNYTGDASLTSTGDFDSIDSYAATFLTLARKLCKVSPSDKNWLISNYSVQLKLIGGALSLVADSDGLTIAKPSYPVKYTMDNSEVNEGLSDMVWLSENIFAKSDSVYWQNLLAANTRSIETDLWDVPNQRYFTNKGGPATNWTVFYADATCQLYPIWCGVILPGSVRAQSLWNAFNANYPDWSNGKIYDPGGFPWTLLSYVAVLMNDKTRGDNYLRFVQSFTNQGHQPTSNWYNLEAAFVIFAAKKLS